MTEQGSFITNRFNLPFYLQSCHLKVFTWQEICLGKLWCKRL